MERRLQQVIKDGKPVWVLTDKAQAIQASCPKCENIRGTREKAQNAELAETAAVGGEIPAHNKE